MDKYFKLIAVSFFIVNVFLHPVQAQDIKVTPTILYFKLSSKVGLIVNSKISYKGRINVPGGGVIGGSVMHGISEAYPIQSKRYDSILGILEPQINAREKVIAAYTDWFTAKGKQVILLPEVLDDSVFKKFKAPLNTNKKYSNRDLRYLKEKYSIDEVLIVTVDYGFNSEYLFNLIEQHRRGRCIITSQVVGLKDNRILIENYSGKLQRVKGEWNVPPPYESFKVSIVTAIEKTLKKEKAKY